jgi:hypothetical protein
MGGAARDAEFREISRSITGSREAFWEGMWKKTSSLFAVPAIGKSIFMQRPLNGSSEARDETNAARRACFLRDHGPPAPSCVRLVDVLEAQMPNGRSCSLKGKASATNARTGTKEKRRRSVQEDLWGRNASNPSMRTVDPDWRGGCPEYSRRVPLMILLASLGLPALGTSARSPKQHHIVFALIRG